MLFSLPATQGGEPTWHHCFLLSQAITSSHLLFWNMCYAFPLLCISLQQIPFEYKLLSYEIKPFYKKSSSDLSKCFLLISSYCRSNNIFITLLLLLGDLNCLYSSVILWGEGVKWASCLPGLLQTYYVAKMILDSWSSQLHLSSSEITVCSTTPTFMKYWEWNSRHSI